MGMTGTQTLTFLHMLEVMLSSKQRMDPAQVWTSSAG